MVKTKYEVHLQKESNNSYFNYLFLIHTCNYWILNVGWKFLFLTANTELTWATDWWWWDLTSCSPIAKKWETVAVMLRVVVLC